MNTTIKLTAACVFLLCSLACSANYDRGPTVPRYFTGEAYERICLHPSMTPAARREAFACNAPPPPAPLPVATLTRR